MKKFLFDTHDFDAVEVVEEKPAFSEEQVALAREQGLAQGRAQGLQEARQQQEQSIADLLQRLSAQILHLSTGEERREMEKSIDAARLALAVTHKLLPSLTQKFPLAEIERVILESIDARRDEPRIAITVPTQHLESLRARIDTIAHDKGYAGKMILIADDAMAASDCRVEWADGGAERVFARLYMLIETEFANAIAGMQAAQDKAEAEQNPPQTGE